MMAEDMSLERVRRPRYQEIWELVRQIPPGKVATYGQIAHIHGGCTARMVGYAMSATDDESGVPWQRVINWQGKISIRQGIGPWLQRKLLEDEGVEFDESGQVDFARFGWRGPGTE